MGPAYSGPWHTGSASGAEVKAYDDLPRCIGCGVIVPFDMADYHCSDERTQAWANLGLKEPVPIKAMALSWEGLCNLAEAQLAVTG